MIKVNDERVSSRMLRQELELLKSRYSARGEKLPDEAKLKEDARENAIEKILLLQEARRRFPQADKTKIEKQFKEIIDQSGGLSKFLEKTGFKQKDIPRLKNEIGDQLKYEKLIEELCLGATLAEEELEDFFEKNKEMFMQPEMVRASHILMRPDASRTEMEVRCELMNLRERALKGEDFNLLASQSSHCRDGNGDLGYFARGQMVQQFEDVAFSLEVNAVSGVFMTEFGLHIVKVFDRKPAHARDFGEARNEIEKMLLDLRKNKMIGEFVDKLRESAKIETGGDSGEDSVKT